MISKTLSILCFVASGCCTVSTMPAICDNARTNTKYSVIANDSIQVTDSVDSGNQLHGSFKVTAYTSQNILVTNDLIGQPPYYYPVLYVNGNGVFTYVYNDTVVGVHNVRRETLTTEETCMCANNQPNGTKFSFDVGTGSIGPLSSVHHGSTISFRVDMCSSTECVKGEEKMFAVE